MRKKMYNMNNTDVLFYSPKELQNLYTEPPSFCLNQNKQDIMRFVQLPQQHFHKTATFKRREITTPSALIQDFNGTVSKIDFNRSLYKPQGGQRLVFGSKSLINLM